MFDLLIKNGLIVDGSGEKAYKGDIAVRDGIIVQLAPSIEGEAAEVIDAAGLMVSPGFIDSHSHSDQEILLGPDGYNMLEQGITTQLAGQCGTGPVPAYPNLYEGIRQRFGDEKVREMEEKCSSYASFMEAVEQMELGTNYAFYASQGNIRGAVMGFKMGDANAEETEAMKKLMAEAMEAGFLGFSTGLIYAPSIYAGTKELVELAKVAHSYGGNYTSHIRGEGCKVKEAMLEASEIGKQSGIPVVISHLKVKGRQYEGESVNMLKIIDDHNAQGITVWAEQYPYLASATSLTSQIPPKFAEGGNDKLVERMKDPVLRKEMERCVFEDYQEFESNIYGAGYEGILITGAYLTPQYVGRYIAEIAETEGKHPFDAICDIIIANNGVVQCNYFSQNESDMLRIIAHPRVMGGCDASDNAEHYDTERQGGGHPRGTSTMVRRLELIRDHDLLPVEESIRRITALPAQVAHLEGIGLLKEGMAADLCIFDYAGLKANSDYVHPFRKNEGIEYVIVGGKVAVRHNTFTGVKNGRVLKRSR
ncbi:MAG: D-aminoacylase, partial [Clostridia bacterium]|nr:D-aminoacylase [Clostridia bacterium]